MNTFKGIAYEILKEVGHPLHSNEITKIALDRGWLKTAGKTPAATMNAQLVVDVNTKDGDSLFIKTAPSTFDINPKTAKTTQEVKKEIAQESKKYKISKNISTKQKGDIAEGRIAELVTLFGDTSLSCYKPISDDEGIDLIVKEKGSLKTLHIQIKSRYGTESDKTFVSRVKQRSVTESHHMAFVFCFFDTDQGDLWDYLWFVPAPDLIKHATTLESEKTGPMYSFVGSRNESERERKWEDFLIDKQGLANEIIAQLKRI